MQITYTKIYCFPNRVVTLHALCTSLPAHVGMAATVNQFKHEFDQYFTDSKQKYHFESDIYDFFSPHAFIPSSTIIDTWAEIEVNHLAALSIIPWATRESQKIVVRGAYFGENGVMWNFGKWPSWFSSSAWGPCMGLLFFVFLNMGPYGRKNFKHLLWKYITDSLQKLHAYFKGGSQPKLYKDWWNVKFWIFANFFFFFVNIGPYGRKKNFRQHLVWKYTRDLLPQIQAYS